MNAARSFTFECRLCGRPISARRIALVNRQRNVPILIDRIDNLVELWRCLVAVSPNERVNLHQFKEATKRWIANMQQVQSTQDGGNNAVEKL